MRILLPSLALALLAGTQLLCCDGPESSAGVSTLAEIDRATQEASPERCRGIAFADVADLCWNREARNGGLAADATRVEQACGATQDDHWRAICWYESAMDWPAGNLARDPYLWCGRSHLPEWCVTHLISARSAPPSLRDAEDAGEQLARLIALELEYIAEALGTPPTPAGGAVSSLHQHQAYHRWWTIFYLGSGRADPGAAQMAPPSQVAPATCAFTREAARLFLEQGVEPAVVPERVLAVWEGVEPAPRSASEEIMLGMLPAPAVPGLPPGHEINALLDQAPSHQARVLAFTLQTLQADTGAPPAAFLPWLEHDEPHVRAWAALLAGLAAQAADECGALARSAQQHQDPRVRTILAQLGCGGDHTSE